MTPLRQKLIDDLDLRSRADTTILAYVSACARLARYHRRSPEHLDLDHVRAFLLHLQRDCMASPANVKLHGTTLERPDLAAALPYPRVPRTPQTRLSPHEVSLLIHAARSPLHRIVCQTLYATGLRVGEVVALQPSDVQSGRGLLLVRRGKGARPRVVMLSGRLLHHLRDCSRTVSTCAPSRRSLDTRSSTPPASGPCGPRCSARPGAHWTDWNRGPSPRRGSAAEPCGRRGFPTSCQAPGASTGRTFWPGSLKLTLSHAPSARPG